MGRILTSVTISNPFSDMEPIPCNALVDTGASHLTLPSAWKERLGQLKRVSKVEMPLANQAVTECEIGGPVEIVVEGFRSVFGEVLFLDMEHQDGGFEPLIGYLVLEACPAAVDMLGHRLVPVKCLDLK